MKILIAGGSGQIGALLARTLTAKGHEIRLLSREVRRFPFVQWDGETLGEWKTEVDGSDVVINLAGRSVICRYTEENLKQMMDSRVKSTQLIGQAIAQAKRPPKLWLQMSTATIYAHTFENANDETQGVIGGTEPDVPRYWDYSIEIARNWEKTLMNAPTPHTRRIALRSAVVMCGDKGGNFNMLNRMVKLGVGGPVAGGKQFVSWIHAEDFVRAVEFLMNHEEIQGAVNLASPNPLPQKEFMAELRRAARMPLGLPATKWMAEIGACLLGTDTELILKSRRVIPGRLNAAGFEFKYPNWKDAARQLLSGDES